MNNQFKEPPFVQLPFDPVVLNLINEEVRGHGLPNVLLGNNISRFHKNRRSNHGQKYIDSSKSSIHFNESSNKSWLMQVKETVWKVMSRDVSKTRAN